MKNRTLAAPILAIVSLLFATPALAAPKTVNVEVRVDSQAPNYEGYRAMDGNPDTMWHTEFGLVEPKHPHEMVIDLGAPYKITGIGYLPRPGGGNGTFRSYQCYVSNNPKQFGEPVAGGEMTVKDAETVVGFPANVKGRYVRLRALSEVAGRPWASVAELRILSPGVVFRAKSSSTFGWLNPDGTPKSETEIEFASLKYDLGKREYFAKIAPETYNPQSLVEADDRDPVDVVLRRTEALLNDLKRMPAAPDLGAQEKKLDELKKVGVAVAVEDVDARLALFEDVCRVRREIAFSNPLLDFDEILFITRHRPGFNHMCDQYYGINAKPGGGVHV
ncbi:MAG: discoidin domain-containing protein, partial [Planctomycetes bacterium]|nr:discoidin domain-containing protein [Planctomycetota bacterium]